jgi:PAS domain S-box-containing protein
VGIEHESERMGNSGDRMITAMRETAARLNGIVQSVMDALITVDENQDIVLFNPAAEKMFGCAAADVLGTPLDQFIPGRHRDAHRRHVDHYGQTGVTTRRMGGSELVGLRANGIEFPVEASISQATVGGKKLFTVILRDIAERKRAEAAIKESAERYQRLVALVPDAIWVEREHRIQLANRACLDLLAVESEERITGRSPLEFIHPDFHALARARRERLMFGIVDDLRVEEKVVRSDGEIRDVEIAETAFRDEGTTVILAVLRDVTDRKRADNELRESRESLRRLSASLQEVREEEKARIARELHDELGQALTSLKMDLEDIAGTFEPQQSERLKRVDAMRSLLNSTVASVRRIATELRPLMLDDLGLIATIEWLTGDFEARTGLQVGVDLPGPDLNVAKDAATALFRVLQESLTNVARHAGASRVDVKLSTSDAATRLEIRDDGKGMEPASMHKSGSFGLLGMRERAAMVGGTLTIDSSPGAGTTIVMTVPSPAA